MLEVPRVKKTPCRFFKLLILASPFSSLNCLKCARLEPSFSVASMGYNLLRKNFLGMLSRDAYFFWFPLWILREHRASFINLNCLPKSRFTFTDQLGTWLLPSPVSLFLSSQPVCSSATCSLQEVSQWCVFPSTPLPCASCCHRLSYAAEVTRSP